MSYEEEFKSVDLLIKSDLLTKMVDSFSLSLIKAERQIRRLFTYLAFQSSGFTYQDSQEMRVVLGDFRNVYFSGFISGINELSNQSLENIFGDRYKEAYEKLETATSHRNKIFHGQLTNEKLSTLDLEKIVSDIQYWCLQLSTTAQEHYGYCGFKRNSFQKSHKDLSGVIEIPFATTEEYRQFINEYMLRGR